MRTTRFLTGALAALPLLAPGAQTVRWNDRPASPWQDQAPRVRVAIVGDRSVALGAPVQVQFEVDEDAFVTVVRVDGNGRMTILYPGTRQVRAAVRGGQVHQVLNPRLGLQAAFVATERTFGGYVFALASFAPLDLSGFENRDFERFGAYSRFTQVNRIFAGRPDEYVERFAAQVLWDPDTPYDFDVDYYFPWGQVTPVNAYALCGAVSRHGYGPVYTLAYDWDASWEFFSSPYSSLCNSYWNEMRCFSIATVFGTPSCYRRAIGVVVRNGPVPGSPGDSAAPNAGVVIGGLATPTPLPVPVNAGDDPPPLERRPATFDGALRGATGEEWDSYLAIPARATRKLKAEGTEPADGGVRRGAAREEPTSRGANAGFDRATAGGKPDKSGVAGAGSAPPPRVQPTREQPDRSRTSPDTRRTTDRSRDPFAGSSRGDRDFGSSGSSRPVREETRGAQPASRPTPTIQSTGSGTTKTKPPESKPPGGMR